MIYLPKNHPSVARLRQQGISICDSKPGDNALRVVILNLMPQKQQAEEEYYSMMDGAELDIQVVLAKMSGLTYKTTPQTYMDEFYTDIAQIMADGDFYHGMIVTGAPLEHLEYTEVKYWQQLREVYHWSFSHVRSTLNICWGAFAALKMFFGIDKVWTEHKLFGVYPHVRVRRDAPLVEGIGLEVMVPISRHITLRREELEAQPELVLLIDQELTGPELAMAWGGRHVFANGHMEYAAGRLRYEYERDLGRGLPIGVPCNYFTDDDPSKEPVVSWQGTGRRFYHNWIRYYVNNSDIKTLPADIDFKD
ncbi:MAG: homoserine O-succinyltransferase [Bacteroidaceae bacterium]|nr:homoserine O-succinyltransferase [Bacteroidaceae bacterium]